MILASNRTLLAALLVLSVACSDDDDTTTGRDPGSANNGANEGTANDGANSGMASNGSTGLDSDAGTSGASGSDAGVDTGGGQDGGAAGGQGGDAGAEGLDDGEIAAVTHAANLGEIKQAELALLRAKASSVREFAQMMLTEHGAAQARQTKLLAQLGLIRRENAVSEKLTQQAGMIMGGLEATDAAGFDVAYIDGQVTLHSAVLKLLDEQLIPSADQMLLSHELQTMRTAVQSHLKHAEELKQSLAPDAG